MAMAVVVACPSSTIADLKDRNLSSEYNYPMPPKFAVSY